MSASTRILLVDDDPVIRESYRRLLGEHTLRIDEARTGREALDRLDEREYQLMLLDLKIPNPGGLTLLRHVRQQHPKTQVIVVTGYATIENVKECIQLGVLEYLQKPPQPERLKELVVSALSKWPSTQEEKRN